MAQDIRNLKSQLSAVNSEIASVTAQIRERKEFLQSRRSEAESDPAYRSARLDYVRDGDRSGLDAYWSGKEAERLRKAQEEANRLAKDKADADEKRIQDEANKAETKELKEAVELMVPKWKTARAQLDKGETVETRGAYDDVNVAMDVAVRKVKEKDPSFKDPRDGYKSEGPGVGEVDITKLKAQVSDLTRKGRKATDAEVKALKESLLPYRDLPAYSKEYQDAVKELDSIPTVEKVAAWNSAQAKKVAEKVDSFNGLNSMERYKAVADEKTFSELKALAVKYGYEYDPKTQTFKQKAKQ